MEDSRSCVLIVDDEEGLRETYREALEAAGHICYTASNGKIALEVLARQDVDVALLDVVMPEMNGPTLFQKMRKDYPRVNAVFISALDRPEVRRNTLGMGAFECLVKPVRLKTLQQTVVDALNSGGASAPSNADAPAAQQPVAPQMGRSVDQERQATQEQFISSFRHDVTNALTPVLSFSELLLERPSILADEERTSRYLRTIYASAQEAIEMIRKLKVLPLQ